MTGIRPPHRPDLDEDHLFSELFRVAGPLDRVPEEELAPLREEARAVWRRQTQRSRFRRRSVLAGLAAAAAVALALGVSMLRPAAPVEPATVAATLETTMGEVTVDGRELPGAPGTELASGARLATGAGGRVALRFPSGHSVRLDGSSTATLEAPDALRLERGAVYVDSGAGPARSAPIEIETRFGVVTDVGTQFEVRLSTEVGDADAARAATAPALRVRVREGEIRLATDAGEHRAQAGTELRLGRDGVVEREAAAPYGPAWAWVESARPPFDTEGASLASLLDWAARESGRSWRYGDGGAPADADDIVLHGSIAGLDVDEALATMLPSCGLRHRIDGGEIIVDRDR